MNDVLDFRKIGNRIQKYRIKNNLTQEALGELVGSTQKYISRIEAGNHKLTLNTVVAIARALHISVDCLVADYDDSTDESTLHEILNDIRGMSATQLDMLRDNINTLKRLNN